MGVVVGLGFAGDVSSDQLKAAAFGPEFGVKNIWLDQGAEFKRPHVADTKLASFFAKNQGPKALVVPSKGFWDQTVEQVVKEVSAKITRANAAKAGEGSSSTVVKFHGIQGMEEKVNAVEEKHKNKRVAELREKAKDSLNKKASAKILQIGKKTAEG